MNRIRQTAIWLAAIALAPALPRPLPAQDPILRKTLQGGKGLGATAPLAFSPDGKLIAAAFHGARGPISLWDVATGAVTERRGHSDTVTDLEFSPDGKTLASAGADHSIRLWRVATGECRATLTGHRGLVWSVAFSPDGRTIASASMDHSLKLWDAVSGENLATFRDAEILIVVVFLPDGKSLLSASEALSVKRWDTTTGASSTVLQRRGSAVFPATFSLDRRMLASTSWGDQPVKLWDIRTGMNTAVLRGHVGKPAALAFSPDGKTLASSGVSMVKLWDVASGRERVVLREYAKTDVVYSVAFSPDGKTLAAGKQDSTIELWDLGTATNTRR